MSQSSITQTAVAQRVEAELVGWRINRLRDALRGPLAIISAGGLRPVATLWARLHEAAGEPAWVISPYDFLSRGVPFGTSILILSRGGRHHDVLTAARHAHRLGRPVHGIVGSPKAPLVSVLRGHSPDSSVFVLEGPGHGSDPDGICRTVPTTILAATLYTQGGPYAACYSVRPPTFPEGQVRQIVALGVGLSFPAAQDFALRCSEQGFAPAMATDPRSLSHGSARPFEPQSTLFVFFGLPKDIPYFERYAQTLPEDAQTVFITTGQLGAAGAVELLAKSPLAARVLKTRPGQRSSEEARWVSDLYFLPLETER